jgi:hypothetical protein
MIALITSLVALNTFLEQINNAKHNVELFVLYYLERGACGKHV